MTEKYFEFNDLFIIRKTEDIKLSDYCSRTLHVFNNMYSYECIAFTTFGATSAK